MQWKSKLVTTMRKNFQLPTICDQMEDKNGGAFCTWEPHNDKVSDRISDPTGDWSEVVRVRDRESRLKPRWSTAGRRDLAKGEGGGATVPRYCSREREGG